jgi:hypothetical protein
MAPLCQNRLHARTHVTETDATKSSHIRKAADDPFLASNSSSWGTAFPRSRWRFTSIARGGDALMRAASDQSKSVRGYLSKVDLTEAAAAANYQWRERVWTPVQTLWRFSLQVLYPGWVCRKAVAHVLARYKAVGTLLNVSADPSAYGHGRR